MAQNNAQIDCLILDEFVDDAQRKLEKGMIPRDLGLITDKKMLAALNSLTAADFAAALEALPLHKRDLEMLQTHYHATERTITATEMAEALGFKRFGAANLHYGTLAQRIGEQLGLQPETSLFVLATFDRPEGEWNWIMRQQVAEALEKLGWVGRQKRGKK